MKISEAAEEILEKMWVFLEDEDDELIPVNEYDEDALKELKNLKLVEYEDDKAQLTPEGFEESKKIIRKHRLAEKLLHDVLGMSGEDMETAACNFEHIMESDVEDSICTIFFHPEVCPHGKPIPPCECLEEARESTDDVKKVLERSILPLTELKDGQSGKIVYIKSDRRENLNMVLAIGLLPGRKVEVIRTSPSYVLQMEHTQIALDSGIAESIYVGELN
ncbi:MAG: metal-dependent transcriptional regulator [Methanobacteriaceae archaeon]